MNHRHYILGGNNGRTPIPADLMTWATGMGKGWERVGFDKVGDIEISTVFLGLNHQWGDGPPLLFETMVFGGLLDQEQERCSTWQQAEAQHAAMVARVQSSEDWPETIDAIQ